MIISRLTTLTLLILLLSSPCLAVEIYMDSQPGATCSGNYSIANRNCSGSDGTSYQTWASAIAAANANDTITIRAGTYDGVDSDTFATYITQDNLTVQGYTGEHPTLKRDDDSTVVIKIYLNTTGVTIKNLEIRGNRTPGQETWNVISIDTNTSNITIQDCTIHTGNLDLIKIPSGSDDVTIKDNTIYNTPRCAITAVNSDNLSITGNYIYDNAQPPLNGTEYFPAILVKGGCLDAVIEKNFVENSQYGIHLGGPTGDYWDTDTNPLYYGCLDCIVRNNIFKDIERDAVGLWSTLRVRFYNNTMINVATDSAGDKGGIIFLVHGNYHNLVTNTDPFVVNNVVYRDSGNYVQYASRIIGVHASTNPSSGTVQGLLTGEAEMDYNYYYDPNTGSLRVVETNPSAWFGDLPGWRLREWHDAAYAEANSVYADPQVSLITGIPNAGSPVIGAGLYIAENTEDYNGNARPNPPSIGAIESDLPIKGGGTPSGTLVCTSNPRTVQIGITTPGASSTCKYDTSDVAYGSMSNTFSTTGGTTHQEDLSLACGSSFTYYVRCYDGSNTNTTSTTISFEIDPDTVGLNAEIGSGSFGITVGGGSFNINR